MKEYKLPETITINQVAQLIQQVKRQLLNTTDVGFNLSEIKAIDSAGIAFLAYLKSKYGNAKFLHSTPQVDNLCQLYKIQL